MSFFDQWLLRLILVSLLTAIPFLLYSVIIHFRPRAFTGRQKRCFWYALLLLFMLSIPLPRLLPLPLPVYQAVSKLRLPSLQTPRLTEYQLEKAERDFNSQMTIIFDDNQGELSRSGEYDDVSYLSQRVLHRYLDRVEMTLPWLRWLYPAGIILLTAVHLIRKRKSWLSLIPGFSRQKEKAVPGTKTAADAEPADPVPGTKTASQKSQLISEWSKVINAWRDELGFYRRCTIRINGDQHQNALWNKLQCVITIPDRQPMAQDLPDHWRKQESISAPIAMALYDLQHPDLMLNGLYKLVRFITWFNPLWLWIGAAWRSDRNQDCQEALAARMCRKKGTADTVNERKQAQRNRLRLADAGLPLCLVTIAVVLLIQMPGLIVPAYQPLSKTRQELFPGDSSWQVDYQYVSDDLLLKPSMFASYQVSELFLSGSTTLRCIVAQKYLDHDTGSGFQNETENLAMLEKRDQDNQLIWQLDLADCYEETETIDQLAIIQQIDQADGSSFVLCRSSVISVESDGMPAFYIAYFYVFQISDDGQLINYYRHEDVSVFENKQCLLDNGELLVTERIRTSEVSDQQSFKYQTVLTRYDRQGQIIWQHHEPQLDHSGEARSGVFFTNMDQILFIAADRSGGFYLVQQEQSAILSVQPRSPQLKFLRGLYGSADDQINPYSSYEYSLHSLVVSPRYTTFYQPARIIHYDQDGQRINQIQLEQTLSETFVPQQGFVNEQDELILMGQAVDQELSGVLPSLGQHLHFIDLKLLQSDNSDVTLNLLPAEQFSEAHVKAQIIAISPEYEVLWYKMLPGFMPAILDFLNDSTGFVVLVDEPFLNLHTDFIESGPVYGRPISSAYIKSSPPFGRPLSSAFKAFLQSRQHFIRFNLNGEITDWQTIEPDEWNHLAANMIFRAAFVGDDRIVCHIQ